MDNQEPGNMHEYGSPDPMGQGGSVPESGPGAPAPQPGQYAPGSPEPPGQPYQPPQYQQPGGQQPPPYQPPQGQPTGQYQQPPPYQQGGQYQQGQYGPPPGYAPPPPSQGQRKGFNWLACCGISCGVMLVIGIIFFVFVFKMANPFIKFGTKIASVQTELNAADPAQMEAEATQVDAEELMGNVGSYGEDWVTVTGELGDNSQMGSTNSGFNDTPSTTYLMKPGIIIMDLSVAPAVGGTGDIVQATGKVVEMDLGSMPLIGKVIKEEMAKDPSLHMPEGKIVFLVTKQVTLISEAEGGAEESTDESASTEPAAEGSESSDSAEAGSSGEKEGW